jgi:RNA polymerase sigma-70 factor, ECF subfamily
MFAYMDDVRTRNVVTIGESPADRDRQLLSDALVKAGCGDKAAFEFIYRKTSAKLFGVCLRIFPERAEAEEALQDAYINIWNRAGRYEAGRASPISWLVAVTRNRAIDRLRSGGKMRSAPIEEANLIADTAPLADAMLQSKDDDNALQSCIETLESKDAVFIRAAFLNGMTYAELADKEALPLGTVKSRIRRALLKLRNCLGGEL